jgi:hypothetical protein
MYEFNCHSWESLRGFESSKNIQSLLERVGNSSDEKEWQAALVLVEDYASDQGIPSEATAAVVACLVAVTIRTDGRKRSALLSTLEELTCGRGIAEYTDQEISWLRASVQELACALQTWSYLAESASEADAVFAVELISYCAVYVPSVESRAIMYLQLCERERPELREELAALEANADEVRQLLVSRGARPGT